MVEGTGATQARPGPPLVGAAVAGTAATGWLALAGSELGRSGRTEDLWFDSVPVLPRGTLAEPAAVVLTMSALAVLAAAWLVLGTALRRGAGPRAVLLVGAAWSVPLLAGPPLFSPDVYAYAAIGSAIQHEVDPYVQGPAAAGDVPGTRGAEPFWRDSPTPYSPPFVVLLNLVSRLLDEDMLLVVLALRLLAVGAWALLAVLLVRLSRCRGIDPARTLWLVVANPLLLVHAVSGAHNDALMTLLVVAGIGAALVRRPYLGVALLAAAACVKVTALALVPVVAVHAAVRQPTWPRRLGAVAGVSAVGFGAFAVVAHAAGYGWRWLDNLDVPGRAVEPLSPPTALAVLLDADDPPLDVVRSIGLAVGVLVCLFLLTRVPRWGLLRVAAWVSLTVVLSGAAAWPWYLTAPTALLALTGWRGHARLIAGWSVAGLFLALPGGRPTLSTLGRPFADAAVLVVLAAVGAVAARTRSRSPREGAAVPPAAQTPVERHSRERSSRT
ncbi:MULTISPECIES: polyprenol phosphomannose-dependent alpha 1,6 mannosyltransferase MptB [unclassified Blastococcus]